MSKNDDVQRLAMEAGRVVAEQLAEVSSAIMGRRVRLLASKYRGRTGVVTGVYIDETHGFMPCVGVERVDGNGLLDNLGDTQAHCCRLMKNVEFLEDADNGRK